MRKHHLGILLCSLLLAAACQKPQEAPLFQLLSPEQTGVHFSNTLNNSDSLIALSFEYLFNGSGVAVADFDQNGWPDLFFTACMEKSQLYFNQGNMQFEEGSEAAQINTAGKWASGATAVDINQDGWMDIYISVGGLSTERAKRSNLLFINQGKQANGQIRFEEKAAAYGLDDSAYSINAAFFDYDRDGDLDLYQLTTELDPYNWTEFRPRRLNGEAPNTDRLYRNNGPNEQGQITFSDVSRAAGILIEGYGLGMGICDLNEDQWPDLYIANDFLSNDILYINNGDGTFTDRIDDYLDHTSRNGMGTDLYDYNNDGLTDIFVLDMLPKSNARQKSMFGFFNYDKFQLGLERDYQPQYARNTLQHNNGNGSFSEIGQLAGIDQTDWSWTSLFADFDNDGWSDILITNGYRQDITNMDFAT
ncbi:MAG: VCBS repeat-containing protein, partial [Bacteroidota bacterium]